MKKVITITLALIFGITLCMSQNIREAQQQQAQREAQQRQAAQQQAQREAEQRARAANSHRVTFNSDGGSAVAPQSIYRNERITRPTAPTRANHAFVEWRRDGESTPFDFSTPITAPITLVAVWTNLEPRVTITPDGTLLQGSTLTRKLDWLERSVESHNTYIIEVSADQQIAPRTLQYRGAINVTIILRGDDLNRTIRLSSHGTMFSVTENVSFVLGNNITLQGHTGNNGAMVRVFNGTFTMNAGATITGNTGATGVEVNGTFTMNGGTISDNSWNGVVNRNTFNMNGGVISGNNAGRGDGGGVHNAGTFTMTGGVIFNNIARNGGGVWNGGTFTMRGGTITSNTAAENGGGVWVGRHSTFTKTGGTITGFNSDRETGNVVRDHSGTLARRGHAVFSPESNRNNVDGQFRWNVMFRRETTAGAGVNLSTSSMNNWEQ